MKAHDKAKHLDQTQGQAQGGLLHIVSEAVADKIASPKLALEKGRPSPKGTLHLEKRPPDLNDTANIINGAQTWVKEAPLQV